MGLMMNPLIVIMLKNKMFYNVFTNSFNKMLIIIYEHFA